MSKKTSIATSLHAEILDDCRVMLRYAKTEGKALDQPTNQLIASTEKLLQARGETLGSTGTEPAKPPSTGTPESPGPSEPATGGSPPLLESLLNLHGSLTTVVAPTTPVSLRATESERSFFGSLGNPPLMLYMMSLSLIFLLGYLFSLPLVSANGGASSAGTSSNANTVTNAASSQKP